MPDPLKKIHPPDRTCTLAGSLIYNNHYVYCLSVPQSVGHSVLRNFKIYVKEFTNTYINYVRSP